MAAQSVFIVACINWQALLTTKQISGLVKVRYWRAPIIWWNYVELENKQSSTTITFEVEIKVLIGL
jgi:hypothetical protein